MLVVVVIIVPVVVIIVPVVVVVVLMVVAIMSMTAVIIVVVVVTLAFAPVTPANVLCLVHIDVRRCEFINRVGRRRSIEMDGALERIGEVNQRLRAED